MAPELAGTTILQARDILAGLHHDMVAHDVIRWLSMLRGELVTLEDAPFDLLTDDDADALGTLV